MRAFLYLIPLTLFFNSTQAQSGCTDPSATNFNATANINDGSCTYNPSVIGYNLKGQINAFANESSGIVFTSGALWTHNDSGNPAKIFKMDRNGQLLQTISITNFPNTDWEDITADSNYIYLEDCGNNNGNRTDLKILKVDKSQFLSNPAAVVNATAQAINLSYADQTDFSSNSNTDYDCEAILSIRDSLYLFSKDHSDLKTRVYKISKNPGTYTLNPYTSFNVNGRITGAGYDSLSKEIVLIGYLASHKNSFLWFLNGYHGDLFFSGNKRRIELGNSTNDWQTEGIDYDPSGGLFFSCENSYTPASLYSTTKTLVSPVGLKVFEKTGQQIRVSPNPASNTLNIELNSHQTNHMVIYNLVGAPVMRVITESAKTIVDISGLDQGAYFISVSNSENQTWTSKFIKF